MLEDLFYYETPKWSHKAHALQTYSCHEIRNMWTRQSSRWSLLSDFHICFQRETWELSSIYHEIGKKQRRCRQDKFSLIDMSKQHMVIRTSFWGATQRSRNTISLHHRKLLKNSLSFLIHGLTMHPWQRPAWLLRLQVWDLDLIQELNRLSSSFAIKKTQDKFESQPLTGNSFIWNESFN